MAFRVAVTRTLPELGERLLSEAEARGEIQCTRWTNEVPLGPPRRSPPPRDQRHAPAPWIGHRFNMVALRESLMACGVEDQALPAVDQNKGVAVGVGSDPPPPRRGGGRHCTNIGNSSSIASSMSRRRDIALWA